VTLAESKARKTPCPYEGILTDQKEHGSGTNVYANQLSRLIEPENAIFLMPYTHRGAV
jgi:hypothetical protein